MDDFSGKIHWNFALLVWVLIQCQATEFFNPIPWMLGAIFPDCDIKYSKLGKILPLWLFFNHRGFTHTLPAMVLFSLPFAYFVSIKWGILFCVGYFLHLVLDCGSPMGIRWIRGHKKKRRVA